jgi:hypothetical protein
MHECQNKGLEKKRQFVRAGEEKTRIEEASGGH